MIIKRTSPIVRIAFVACEAERYAQMNHPLDIALHCKYNVVMKKLRFEWDPNKSKANQDKHGVSFEEAASVFYDEWGRLSFMMTKIQIGKIGSSF